MGEQNNSEQPFHFLLKESDLCLKWKKRIDLNLHENLSDTINIAKSVKERILK
jgi:hypothetical protein